MGFNWLQLITAFGFSVLLCAAFVLLRKLLEETLPTMNKQPEELMMDEDSRPMRTKEGLTLKEGDLVRIQSRGFSFVCFIDDSCDCSLRPATPTSSDNEQWLNAADWDTVELIESCALRCSAKL